MKHKWYEEICAWAGGAEIEYRKKTGYGCIALDWISISQQESIDWLMDEFEYRIKPTPKEPQYLYVYESLFDEKIVSLGKTQYAENNQIWKTIGKIPLIGVDDAV